MGNQLSARAIGPIQSKAEAVTEALKPETVAEVSAGSRPWDKGGEGGGRSAIKFFRVFGPQFGLKIRRGGGGTGPSPGSATGSAKLLGSCKRLCQVQTWSGHSVWTETYHISGTRKKTKYSAIKRKGQQIEKRCRNPLHNQCQPYSTPWCSLEARIKWSKVIGYASRSLKLYLERGYSQT